MSRNKAKKMATPFPRLPHALQYRAWPNLTMPRLASLGDATPCFSLAGNSYCSGFGFCDNAHSRSHLMAAARDSNRCLNRKSSKACINSSDTIKFSNGFLPIRPAFADIKRNPCFALPNLARLHRSELNHAERYSTRSGLSHQCQTANPGRQGRSPVSIPCGGLPCRALLGFAPLLLASFRVSPFSPGTEAPGPLRKPLPWLATPRRTVPCNATLRDSPPLKAGLHRVHSQSNSRQFGGINPRLRPLDTMPLCLMSMRNMWHRRHNVRKLSLPLLASRPLLMWSMCALSRGKLQSNLSAQYGPWQRPLSRSQTSFRVSAHTARCCRFTPMLLGHNKGFDIKSAHADFSTVGKPDQFPGVNDTRFHFPATDYGFVPEQMESSSPSRRTCQPVADIPAFGAWIYASPNVQINKIVRVVAAWFNGFNVKRFFARPARIEAIKENFVVRDLQRGPDKRDKRLSPPLNAFTPGADHGEHIGRVNKKLTVLVHDTGFAPFVRRIASRAVLFLLFQWNAVAGKSVLEKGPGSDNFNFSRYDVSHGFPRLVGVDVLSMDAI